MKLPLFFLGGSHHIATQGEMAPFGTTTTKKYKTRGTMLLFKGWVLNQET